MIICAILLSAGCAEKQDKNPSARRKKPGSKKKAAETVNAIKEFEQDQYEYKGGKYRSPFSSSGKGAVSSTGSKSESGSKKTAVLSNPETLKITGLFSDNSGTYAILSGVNEFFIVKKGRLYNEDRLEVPGVAVIIKKDKIILITGKDTMFELAIPQ